eukprot:1155297-Pelagomonas_calceolata.AAC.1
MGAPSRNSRMCLQTRQKPFGSKSGGGASKSNCSSTTSRWLRSWPSAGRKQPANRCGLELEYSTISKKSWPSAERKLPGGG